MINKIEGFILILGILFILKNVIDFSIRFFTPESTPMVFTKYEKIILYVSLSYVITYIFF